MDRKRPTNAMPTISDVAQRAGVSRAVASRALSPQRRPVSAHKRALVEAAAAELGYRANLMARSLTTQTLDLVAVVVNHIHDLSDLDLFDRLLSEIQAIGKQAIMIRIASADKAEEFLRRGVAYHVDAALVFSDFADAPTVRSLFRSERVIMLNGRHDSFSPAVVPNEAIGIGEALDDAAGKGVKTAALITGRTTSRVEVDRIAAYRDGMAARGIALLRSVQGDYSYASGRAAASILAADDWPDAVFCTADAMAMGVLDARRADFPNGRPEKFRLYGFDNLSLLDLAAYPIATIGYDKPAYVRAIASLLGAAATGPSLINVPTHFVPGATA